MGIKKKLGLGMAAGALGLSLVGGGTYAYFSDKATVHNALATGTLQFEVKSPSAWPVNFDLANLRPGDSIKREFELKNTGSLAIESTYLNLVNASVLDANSHNSAAKDELLNTLRVNYFWQGHENSDWKPINILVDNNPNTYLTLNDVLYKNYAGKVDPKFLKNGEINLTPDGINTGKFGRFIIRIQFPDNGQPQNNLQGLTAKFDFALEARQVIGAKDHPEPWGPNGKIVGNEVQGLTNFGVDGNNLMVDPPVENHQK